MIGDLLDGRLAAVGTWSLVSLVYGFCSFAIVGGLCFDSLVMTTKMRTFTSSRNERDFRSTECNVLEDDAEQLGVALIRREPSGCSVFFGSPVRRVWPMSGQLSGKKPWRKRAWRIRTSVERERILWGSPTGVAVSRQRGAM